MNTKVINILNFSIKIIALCSFFKEKVVNSTVLTKSVFCALHSTVDRVNFKLCHMMLHIQAIHT